MHKLYKSIIESIGNTPLVEISRLNPNKKVKILQKLKVLIPADPLRIALHYL